jgi:DNA replication protein DnaC
LKIAHTIQNLRQLKLTGLADGLERQLAQADTHSLSFEERIALLVDCEITARDNRKLGRLLRKAKFREHACVEDIDYRHSRGLTKSQMAAMASCDWVRKNQNLCITGATGTGKTFLACALGNQACRQGLSAKYFRLPRLFEMLRVAHGDGSFLRLTVALAKIDLLVLDDWGLQKPAAQERNDLLEILEDRYKKRATLVTSQLPVKSWHGYLGDATMADAILDRLLHNAHKLPLAGESMRKKTRNIDED